MSDQTFARWFLGGVTLLSGAITALMVWGAFAVGPEDAREMLALNAPLSGIITAVLAAITVAVFAEKSA